MSGWRDARVTAGIALVTVAAWALMAVTGTLSAAAYGLGFVADRFGGGSLPDGLPLVVPAALTPLTATLVHGGLMHLAFNLVMLAYCGRLLEQAIGGTGVVVVYAIGAYAAAAAQWAWDPASGVPMIGASGAISAVVGAYALLYGRRRAKPLGRVPADVVHVAWLAAAWIGVQLLIGATGGEGGSIAIGAHIGGFVAGLVLARPLLLWRYRGA